jgi:hypothetical protein
MKRSTICVIGTGLCTCLLFSGCQSNSAARQQSKAGAGYGALTGAVSGFFWGLLRGKPIQGVAEGAFVGGATGAVVGGVHGASQDRDLKKEIGPDNYTAMMALVHRDYPAARRQAAVTADDPDPRYRLASAWISALVAVETLDKEELEPYYLKLIELSPDLETVEDARVELRLARRDLRDMRKKFNVH